MAREGGLFRRALDEVESRTGYVFEKADRVEQLEESDRDARYLRREMDLLAYTALDYFSGREQDLTPESRRRLTQQGRVAWMRDPQAGAAVDLMNDFSLGRGVPRPRAKDPEVQKIVDEAWDDPDNQRVLTSYQAQIALGTDLTLQSNLFALCFDDGEDGKVKVSLLDHDAVERIIRHPDDRFMPLWYVTRQRRVEWDYVNDQPKPVLETEDGKPKILYYEHFENVQLATDRASRAGLAPPPKPPSSKIGKGRVFHIAENRTSEMAFGHPRMERTLRWFSAYNNFLTARVDMMTASAAYVMKRRVTGSKNQVTKMATQALSRRSELSVDPVTGEQLPVGPMAASVITENDKVVHEPFTLNSQAQNAAVDARMIGGQVSAATRFPRSYYGDADASNLATATSLELPVLKGVEARQELLEGLFRWFIDTVIDRAIEAKRITKDLTAEELAKKKEEVAKANGGQMPEETPAPTTDLAAAAMDPQDPEFSQRDLSYEFAMPNPLRRALTDLVGAVQNIARTFDPNNTNVELSRALLQIALSDGLEVQDAAGVVERVFPPNYVDPAIAAAQAQAGGGGPMQGPGGITLLPGQQDSPFGEFGPPNGGGFQGADGQQHQQDNAYGAPKKSTPPERVQAALIEARFEQLPEDVRHEVERRLTEQTGPLADVVTRALAQVSVTHVNGNGNGKR